MQKPEAAVQPRDAFLAVNGRRHHYLEWAGEGGTLVLLHGGNSSARGSWIRTAPAFIDRYRVIAPDHRGHGETDWDPDAGYTLTNYVADFEVVVAQLGLVTFDLVGHSLGGIVGLSYAAAHPDKVRRLVLVDSGPRDFKPDEVERWRAQQTERPPSFNTREEAEAFARRSFPDATRDRSLAYGFVQRTDGTWTWRADVVGLSKARSLDDRRARERSLWLQLRALRCPTLIVIGGKSFFHDESNVQRLEDANRLVRVIIYPEAHHWVHDDESDRFKGDVRAFLAEKP